MAKMTLQDGTEIQLEEGSWIGYLVARVDNYEELEILDSKLTSDNLAIVKMEPTPTESETYFNAALNEPHFTLTKENSGIKVQFGLRLLSEAEIKLPLVDSLISILTDEQATQVKTLYNSWESLVGKIVARGTRFTYGGKLYKVITPDDLEIQAQWIPGQGTSAIYSQISEGGEGEEGSDIGTFENPIEVPSDVTTNAFTYITGKYYKWNNIIYKCERQGDGDGVEYSFVYSPDQVPGYFTVIG